MVRGVLLLLVAAVGSGPRRTSDFLDWTAQPWVIALNVVATAFLLLHAVTWFNLAPKAMVVRLGGRPVPPRAVLAAHYAAVGGVLGDGGVGGAAMTGPRGRDRGGHRSRWCGCCSARAAWSRPC